MGRKHIVSVILFLGITLLLSYFYKSFLNSTNKEMIEWSNFIDDDDDDAKIPVEVMNRAYSYPYVTQCSMWNTQPTPARNPRWVQQYNPTCRRYGFLPFSQKAGFGHKTDNFMNGLIFTSALNMTYVMTDGFETSSKHLPIKGIVDTLGFGSFSPSIHSVNTSLKKLWHLNWDKTYQSQITKSKNSNRCNTTYRISQFFADDRSPVRWHMAHMVQNRLFTTRTQKTAYSADKFNIAVHLRYSSSSPYKKDGGLEKYNSDPSTTVVMVKYFTEVLESVGVPYVIHFFTAGDVSEEILGAFPGSVVHGREMSVVDTIQHFIESDLLFCLMSSMCRVASIMSTRPLVINGYPTAEEFFYDPCPRDVFCGLLNRTSEPDISLIRQIKEAGERWLISRKLNCPSE